jgi:uncharacterized protein RhaS with RHS repeats
LAKYNAGTTLSGCTVTGTPAKTVTLTYDNNGNPTTLTDASGDTVYAYDVDNLLRTGGDSLVIAKCAPRG